MRGEGESWGDGTSVKVVGMSGQTRWHAPRARLTGRGAIVVMLAVFTLGLLGASWLRWPVLAGASFVAGSVAAVCYVRTRDLLVATVVPPLLFGIVLAVVKAVTATGSVVLSIAEGTAITLAEVAPWLFAGMALTLVVAWVRGLRGCVRELREELRLADDRPGPAVGPRTGPAAQDEPSPPLTTPGNPHSGPAA
jgi:hypothetical protein